MIIYVFINAVIKVVILILGLNDFRLFNVLFYNFWA